MASGLTNHRPGINLKRLWLSWIVALSIVPLCHADSLRVTTWNLAPADNSVEEPVRILQAADTLRRLNPDVILLQHVEDWHMCERLANAIAPLEYNVVMCSAFAQASALSPARPQLAILAKTKAYFTWSESWSAAATELADGFGFAAIDFGNRRLGFMTVLCSGRMSGEDFAKRLHTELNSVGSWETNRVQTFVIGASADPFSRRSSRMIRKAAGPMEKAGLIDAAENLPSEVKATLRPNERRTPAVADWLYAGPQGFPMNTRISVCSVSEHYPVTSDIELDPEKVSLALDVRTEERREREAQTEEMVRKAAFGTGGAVLLIIGVRVIFVRQARKARRRRGLTTAAIPRDTAAPLRPVILARPSSETTVPGRIGLPQKSRPVLRLQSGSRGVQPASEQGPWEPIDPKPQQRPAQSSPPPPQLLETPVRPAPTQPPPLPASEDPAVRQGVIQELSQWLKQKLVRKLVSDREQLLEAQRIATTMASTIDNRLSRIEAQLEQQNQAYGKRIEELNKELAAAREENRQLIRERIAQVKAEMEAARAKVLAEANLDNNSFRL